MFPAAREHETYGVRQIYSDAPIGCQQGAIAVISAVEKFTQSHPLMSDGSIRLLTVIMTLFIGGTFTFWVVNPSVGIDDANITQVYAQAFAERLEFTYYEGGERVEGSTSLLWTLINAFAYAVPGTGELWITVICLALTGITLNNCWIVGKETFVIPDQTSLTPYSLLFCALFLMVPSFFTWSVWSLMDIAIWLALLSAILVFTVKQLNVASAPMTRDRFVLVASCFALLTITRPEGIAISTGILIYLVLHAHILKQRKTRSQYLLTIVLAFALFGAATWWRMSYFGTPVPNTFYAKVTNGALEQAMAGGVYFLKFVQADFNAFLLIAAGAGIVSRLNLRQGFWITIFDAKALLVLFLLGLFALYMALGGDHFGSYRFYQPAFLVLVPVIAGSACYLLAKADVGQSMPSIRIVFATAIICVSLALFSFSQNAGRLDHEFRIAESGRALGERLNRLSPDTSIAVISAGGPAMTYKQGPIYDLMGLNWTTMAHAEDNTPAAVANFGNFVEPVFWQTRPDVVVPRLLPDCAFVDRYPTEFWSAALKGMLQSDPFNAEYELVCERSVALFARRDIAAKIRTELMGS